MLPRSPLFLGVCSTGTNRGMNGSSRSVSNHPNIDFRHENQYPSGVELRTAAPARLNRILRAIESISSECTLSRHHVDIHTRKRYLNIPKHYLKLAMSPFDTIQERDYLLRNFIRLRRVIMSLVSLCMCMLICSFEALITRKILTNDQV